MSCSVDIYSVPEHVLITSSDILRRLLSCSLSWTPWPYDSVPVHRSVVFQAHFLERQLIVEVTVLTGEQPSSVLVDQETPGSILPRRFSFAADRN